MDVLKRFITKSESQRLKIAVIGDTLLDEYYAIKVNRISPEFPIEVMLSESDQPVSTIPGGAGNVCAQLRYWNTDAYLLSVVDRYAHGVMTCNGINTDYCVVLDNWTTPRKKRLYDGDFPIGRWDVEFKKDKTDTDEWRKARYELVANVCDMLIKIQPDIVIMSDYGKGIYDTASMSQAIIAYCSAKGVPTIVDPKTLDFRFWENCTYLKPNTDWLRSFCDKYGKESVNPDGVKWGEELEFLWQKIKCIGIILTDSGNGMALLQDHPRFYTSPELSKRRPVIRSVIGAGDCFCAFLAMATAYSFTLEEAMTLAFNGSSAYIEDKHNNPVTPYVFTKWFDPIQAKKVSLEKLLAIKSQLLNRKWVWTNGCFDGGIHPGHLKTFEEAKKLGDFVIVGLNTDESVKILKGDSRPIFTYDQREEQLAHLQYVDFIVPIKNRTPEALIEVLNPTKIVKGEDYYKKDIAGSKVVGHQNVHLVPLIPNMSTSKIIEKVKKIADEIWVFGRVFVYADEGLVEYFYRFEEGGQTIRSVCGGLREKHLCKPLDYVCNMKYLRNEPVFKEGYGR